MRPPLPSLAASGVVLAAAAGFFVAFTAAWDNRPIGAALTTVLVVLMLLTPPARADHDACAGCRHRRVEHHGICQACQREVVSRSVGAPDVACWRFEPQGGVDDAVRDA